MGVAGGRSRLTVLTERSGRETSSSSYLKMEETNYSSCFFPKDVECPLRANARSPWKTKRVPCKGPSVWKRSKCCVQICFMRRYGDIGITCRETLKRLKLFNLCYSSNVIHITEVLASGLPFKKIFNKHITFPRKQFFFPTEFCADPL